jgi:hypothetical protein
MFMASHPLADDGGIVVFSDVMHTRALTTLGRPGGNRKGQPAVGRQRYCRLRLSA